MKIQHLFYALLVLCAEVIAYEPITHAELSANAVGKSILDKPEFLARLGLSAARIDDSSSNRFQPSEPGRPKSILELIRFGSEWEDDRGSIIQSTRHFYDPVNNAALNAGPFVSLSPPRLIPKQTGIRSPDWALEDTAKFDGLLIPLPQKFSFRSGRKYFYDALTKPTKEERDANWGLTFQTVGHVIHHLQDMAQPQHTRNDFHCDFSLCLLTGQLGAINPSFEMWTSKNQDARQYDGYTPVYSKETPNGFAKPRDFWQSSGKGIAEYSNRNFLTAGTNADSARYASPRNSMGGGQKSDIAVICADWAAKGRDPCPPGLRGNMTFYSTPVTDTLTPSQSGVNPRATSRSIFDPELKQKNGEETFAVNRFTYDATNEFTLKRAVAYSAGMINYFFRGDIDLQADSQTIGSYRIKNLTQERMLGTFELFYETTGGVRRPVPNAKWTNVLIEPSSESDPASGFLVSFQQPTGPAPRNPGEFTLVFNGDLGEEKQQPNEPGAVTGRVIDLKSHLLLLSKGVLYRSADLGNSWQVYFQTGNPNFTTLRPLGANTVLSRNMISRDAGKSWESLSNDPQAIRYRAVGRPNGQGALITFEPADATLPIDHPDFQKVRVVKSTDMGATWSAGPMLNAWVGGRAQALGAGKMVAGGARPLSGAQDGCGLFGTGLCRDFTGVTYESLDGGNTWVQLFDSRSGPGLYIGKTVGQAESTAIDPSGADTFISAFVIDESTQVSEFRISRDKGRTWVRQGAIADDDSTLYDRYVFQFFVNAGFGTFFALFEQKGLGDYRLFRSMNFGATWTRAAEIPVYAKINAVNAMEYVGPKGTIPGLN